MPIVLGWRVALVAVALFALLSPARARSPEIYAGILPATAVGGYAWNAVGKVWYQVMLNLLPRSTFADCARQCRQVARGMSPPLGQRTIDAIDAAWTAVGL